MTREAFEEKVTAAIERFDINRSDAQAVVEAHVMIVSAAFLAGDEPARVARMLLNEPLEGL